MQSEKINPVDVSGAEIARAGDMQEQIKVKGHYDVICVGSDGATKWVDAIENLVVTVGKNDLLTQYFKGTSWTAAWYMGLVEQIGSFVPQYSTGDTLASHGNGTSTGWAESTAYSGTNRITVGWGTASAGSLSSTSTTFSINGTATIAGALMCQTQTRATTTGVLYSAGSFTGGNRSVVSGDSLLVTFTASV
jgi:hypothetical protein